MTKAERLMDILPEVVCIGVENGMMRAYNAAPDPSMDMLCGYVVRGVQDAVRRFQEQAREVEERAAPTPA